MTTNALRWADDPGEHADKNAGAGEATGGGGGTGVGPVCIGEVEGPLRAEIARSYLEEAGIDAFLQGEAVAGVYGVVSGPLGTFRVLVPAAQAEEAARIFSELDFGDA